MFLNTIPDSDVTQAGRRKAHFALMAVAGNILEDVFKDIGIEHPELAGIIAPKKASAVCTKYFMEAVHENAFESQDIQALRLCYDHVTINPKAFYVENCTANGTTMELLTGCERDVMGWTSEHRLDFHKGALDKYLNDNGQVNLKQLVKIWKSKGILNSGSDEGRTTLHIFKGGMAEKNSRVPVISFNRGAVEDILGISSTNTGGGDNNPTGDILEHLKRDVQAYADCTLDRDVHTGDVLELAMGVFNDNGDYYERQGISVDDIIMAIGSMRLV